MTHRDLILSIADLEEFKTRASLLGRGDLETAEILLSQKLDEYVAMPQDIWDAEAHRLCLEKYNYVREVREERDSKRPANTPEKINGLVEWLGN